MNRLGEELTAFRRRRDGEQLAARQNVAFFLATGTELADALTTSPGERGRLAIRLERERLRGMRRHWSYDLNRHIALKQALDRLRRPVPG